jgi:hypothetical protein
LNGRHDDEIDSNAQHHQQQANKKEVQLRHGWPYAAPCRTPSLAKQTADETMMTQTVALMLSPEWDDDAS